MTTLGLVSFKRRAPKNVTGGGLYPNSCLVGISIQTPMWSLCILPNDKYPPLLILRDGLPKQQSIGQSLDRLYVRGPRPYFVLSKSSRFRRNIHAFNSG